MRKNAREAVFKLIFEYQFKKEKNIELMEDMFVSPDYKLDQSDIEYIRTVYIGVANNYEDLMDQISEKTEGFSVDRIYKTDRALLLLAVYEMQFMGDIPNKVSINEALDLAKQYGTDKSNSFINGVLAKFVVNE